MQRAGTDNGKMGHTLQKTCVSVAIKERLDFSCALFDSDGGLCANAPHVPYVPIPCFCYILLTLFWQSTSGKHARERSLPAHAALENTQAGRRARYESSAGRRSKNPR